MSESQNVKFKPGKVLDEKWIIIELIGKGAMGEVYRAHQTNLKRDVAIKIISDDVLSDIEEDPDELAIAFGRFQREVQTMAQVRHANILAIYDYGEIVETEESKESHIAYIVMEYIPGNSMRFTLSEDGLDDVPEMYGEWIKNIFMPILDGVEVLHTNKIIHRDLKPENIFMDGAVPKIADFGLARSYQMKAVTSSLEMLGTLAYMSPEQCSDFKNADYPTDIYALGKILFEAVNGTLTQKVVPFTSVGIDDPQNDFLVAVNSIIGKATAEEPRDRYQTVQELRSDLLKALPLLDEEQSEGATSIQVPSKGNINRFTWGKIRWLAGGIVLAIISVTAMAVYHFLDKQENILRLDEKALIDNSNIKSDEFIVTPENLEALEKDIIGRDGSQMLLTGDINGLPEGATAFYLDTQKVTNFLFVEFLNTIKDAIFVENGVVRHGDTIIMYIGTGSSSEDKIIFQHNQFHLKNQEEGVEPVLRTTFHGAQMYAKSFNKKLLTEDDWRFAYVYHLQNQANEEPAKVQSEEKESHESMHSNFTRSGSEHEKGVLDNMGESIKEWVYTTRPATADSPASANDTSFSGVMDVTLVNKNEKALLRHPWEGFFDVGFRTMVPVTYQEHYVQ